MSVERLLANHVINDPIHGYVGLTDLEYALLQLPAFTRLHRVRQNATTFLTFPGTLTSRFEHVVGALHMGYRIITRLLNPLPDTIFDELFKETGENRVETRLALIKSVRLACLCHDLGHGPFSHTAEEIMLEVARQRDDEMSEAQTLYGVKTPEDVPIHEYYSYKLVTSGDVKDEIINKEGDGILKTVACLLTKDKNDPIFSQHPEGMKILRKIIASQLDADRMDYLQRDSLKSGVKYGQVDAERVIRNMLIHRTKTGTFDVAIHDRALGSIEDMLDARYKMYKWFYSHHTVIATNNLVGDAMSQMLSDHILEHEVFHWSYYSEGLGTDDFILDNLALTLRRGNNDYLIYKGLLDRRYIPVSILKYDGHRIALKNKIAEHSGTQINFEAKIRSFIEDIRNVGALKKALEDEGGEIARAHIIGVYMPRTPYKPLTTGTNNVWLYCEKDERLVELTEASSYFRRVNDEWASSSSSAYLSYLIPGKTKEEAKQYRDKIFEIIAKTIALN